MAKYITAISAVLAVFIEICSTAIAAPITFIHSGSGSGSLGGVSFEEVNFSILAIGETANRVIIDDKIYAVQHDSAEISIEGIGQFFFSEPTRTFVNGTFVGLVGFSRSDNGGLTGADLFDGPVNPIFGSWDLFSSVGPVAGDAYLFQWWDGLYTTGGHSDV